MIRAAAYARVSTDKDDQLNSLENQKSFFESYIRARTDWEFAGVYFDEGVTGTQAKKRAGFKRMIEKCRVGEIDLVLTKEVSRFARNTVDALKYTRLLSEYGVGVIFIGDNIDTRDNDGEFRLSIMASVAQEESRKISERVKWGQRRAMEKGVVFGNNSIFGFDLKNGRLTINETEAETVRLIFHKYINEHKGAHIIARELYEGGVKPPRRADGIWSGAMIMRILKNEKYVGDLLQKKYVTKDYLTHKKVINSGEKILIKNHHKAIINRETWERAQLELENRRRAAENGKKYSGKYWCSGKIVCGECGAGFIVRKSRKKSGVYTAWMCRCRMKGKCAGRTVNNKSLLECMSFVTGLVGIDYTAAADNLAKELCCPDGDNALCATESKIQGTEMKKLKMLDSYYAGEISSSEMAMLRQKYDEELKRLQALLAGEKKRAELHKKNAGEIRDIIMKNAAYPEYIYGELLDKMTVYRDHILIRLKHLDFAFKICYSVSGYKENYTTEIKSCVIIRDKGAKE